MRLVLPSSKVVAQPPARDAAHNAHHDGHSSKVGASAPHAEAEVFHQVPHAEVRHGAEHERLCGVAEDDQHVHAVAKHLANRVQIVAVARTAARSGSARRRRILEVVRRRLRRDAPNDEWQHAHGLGEEDDAPLIVIGHERHVEPVTRNHEAERIADGNG